MHGVAQHGTSWYIIPRLGTERNITDIGILTMQWEGSGSEWDLCDRVGGFAELPRGSSAASASAASAAAAAASALRRRVMPANWQHHAATMAAGKQTIGPARRAIGISGALHLCVERSASPAGLSSVPCGQQRDAAAQHEGSGRYTQGPHGRARRHDCIASVNGESSEPATPRRLKEGQSVEWEVHRET